jgi:cephalosporin hydroxylase
MRIVIKKEYDRVKKFTEQGLRFSQIAEEIMPFMEFTLSHLTPADKIDFMEIGLAFGCNFVFMGNCLNSFMPDMTKGYAIDLPLKRRWEKLDFDLSDSIIKLIPEFPYFLHMGESCDRYAYNEIEKALGGNKLDLLFIDGNHTYRYCKGDFKLYRRLVREGGLIAFHDIRGTKKGAFKVWKLWREIKDKYEHKEFVTNKEDNGIGVIINA